MDPTKVKIIPSHAIGAWALNIIHKFLGWLGMSHDETLVEVLYIILILALSLTIGWVIKRAIVAMLRQFVEMRHSEFGREMLDQRVISRCAHFVPPLVFLACVPIAFDSSNKLLAVVERLAGVYALIAFGVGVAAVMSFIFYRYNTHDNDRRLPLKGLLNVARGVLWIIITIIAVSILVDKSPAYLLTGLGAFAAALMLIFKDSILGFVAGIQMSQNDMLHVGDWIVVPSTPANGVVIDVTLSAVKIQNFDNTIVTVPPYTLVSTSFQNYRGMKLSGMRRMTRELIIDSTTVVRCTPDMIAKAVAAYPELKGFVDNLQGSDKLIAAEAGNRPVNGTLETNLGLFRAYATMYLTTNKLINPDGQILVRILDPTPNGFPVDFYCFTNTTDWNAFEAIQSAVMEHLAIATADFGLAVYTSGSMDVEMIGRQA